MFQVKEHKISGQHVRGYPHATRHVQEEVLQLAVKQYIPLRSNTRHKDAVTIIGAHANGFPKELYEPLWDELLVRADATGFAIRGIWIADIASQGQSSILNEGKLGNDPSWFDHPRDLLHIINHFRDEMPRPLFGIGHSMGGNNLVNLSLIHPRLLEGQILIDPVIQRAVDARGNFTPAYMSSIRRDLWPSREAAKAAFLRSKFYQAWDGRVLELWIKYGLRDLPTEVHQIAQPAVTPAPMTTEPTITPPPREIESTRQVTLTTTKHNEVFQFLRPHFQNHNREGKVDPSIERLTHPEYDSQKTTPALFYRPEPLITFQNLPFLRPSVLYIFGEESFLSAPALKADKMAVTGIGIGGSGGAKEGRVQEITMRKTGHLIPMEKVTETAEACASWIGREMERWRANETILEKQWADTPERDRYMLSQKHLDMLKSDTKIKLDEADKEAKGKVHSASSQSKL